jgi:hypothetical protein
VHEASPCTKFSLGSEQSQDVLLIVEILSREALWLSKNPGQIPTGRRVSMPFRGEAALDCGGASHRFQTRSTTPNPKLINSLMRKRHEIKSGGWRHRTPKRFARNVTLG